MLEENKDYELAPGDDDHWYIRILKGEFSETVFRFGVIKVSEDGEYLKYDANVISTPDEDLDENNEDFQQLTGDILLSVIQSSIDNNWEVREKE